MSLAPMPLPVASVAAYLMALTLLLAVFCAGITADKRRLLTRRPRARRGGRVRSMATARTGDVAMGDFVAPDRWREAVGR